MITISLQQLAFYSAIFFTVFGGILGLVGVWFEDFFKNEVGFKLFITDVVLASTSIIVAAIAAWLGG